MLEKKLKMENIESWLLPLIRYDKLCSAPNRVFLLLVNYQNKEGSGNNVQIHVVI